MDNVNESAINLISEGTRIEGKAIFDQISRFHGTLVGEAHGRDGSTLILCESSLIQGDIFADTVMIDGFVQGNIHARTRVVISGTGRVVGNIETPSIKLEFGAYFEGRCMMEKLP
jgi:cytoskeletal protein CcmA (bactofilin family)